MAHQVHYLKDYQQLAFQIERVALSFAIFEEHVEVRNQMQIRRSDGAANVVLNGSADLEAILLDGAPIAQEAVTLNHDDETLILPASLLPKQDFCLEIHTRLEPQHNKSLMGLYESGGNLYTQCEPEGFRKITFYPDRPDMMSVFDVRIEADEARYPVLLSNGNLVAQGQGEHGRHWVCWQDPFPKPSYLFALVAGDLAHKRDVYHTLSGREIELVFYTREHDIDKVDFAIESLKNAMRWDEERFGLEYDLAIYMVVAVSDFNMGAMENKGLNIFNTKFVLASPETATDSDFEGVESVIGHEYFHNWTGNRVTCRDWFQLSLKEGLTVFRDQEFSADRASRAVRRIYNVSLLRQHQFPEDAGPMAHPVRPASYVEMNNFYTMTVYEKGAEVVRMYHTLLGEAGFQKGMQLYFQRHDGQAVTCDDFLAAMADANGEDFNQFALWYAQAGTPSVSAKLQRENTHTLVLTLEQHIPATPDMSEKSPMLLPIKLGLINQAGQSVSFALAEDAPLQEEAVLRFNQKQQSYRLYGVEEDVIPSLLRGFSAPVHLHYPYQERELAILLAHDSDSFARWEAGQMLYRRAIVAKLAALEAQQPLPQTGALIAALNTALANPNLDPAFKATLLAIPPEAELWAESKKGIEPLHYYQARQALQQEIAQGCVDELIRLAQLAAQVEQASQAPNPYAYHPELAAWRSLWNQCRQYLLLAKPEIINEIAVDYPQLANNMTHEWGILSAINHHESPLRNTLLAAFAQKFANEALVMDKYFSLIASSYREDTPIQIKQALHHPAFSLENPNKARALLGSFSRNIPHFHAANGQGYAFLADHIVEIDSFNPQVAARLVQAFNLCQRLEPKRQTLMLQQLKRIHQHPKLSKDVGEIVDKILLATEG